MITLSLLKKKSMLLLMLSVLVVSMLYVGLREDIPSRNQVSFSQSNGALVFGERGLAYSKQNLNPVQIDHLNNSGFMIKLTFSPVSYEKSNFQFLVLLSNGDTSEQLIIAQVRDYIIVMNGDDYNYRKKSPRISIKLKDRFKGYQQLTLTVDQQTTKLVLNNNITVQKNGQLVQLPNPKKGVKLLLSGSELLENNWLGEIGLLAIGPLKSAREPPLLVNFVARSGEQKNNQTSDWLLLPEKLTLLKHQVLEASPFKINSKSALHDILINFLGFMPFGLVLCLLLMKLPVSFSRAWYKSAFILFMTFLCAFLLSFIIEYRQAWLVTRHSSLRDLYLNTLGGVAGGVFVLLAIKLKEWLRRRHAENNCDQV